MSQLNPQKEHALESNLAQPAEDSPILIAWFVVLFVAAIGIANGGSDQAVYLLHGLAEADPSYLRGDWFTWDTAPAHEVFGFLVALISRLGSLEVGLALGAFVQSAALAVAVYYGVRAVYDRPLLPWALSMLLLSAVGTRGIGLSRLINPHMQASAIGGVCLLTGLVVLAWNKRCPAGLLLGLGGLFHAHFAVLTLAVLVPMTLAEPRPRKRFVTSVWFPYLALSSYNLIKAALYAVAPGSGQSTAIALARFPHHLVPSSWSPESYGFFVAVILAGIGGWLVRRPKPNRSLAWAVISIGLIVFLSVIIGYLEVFEPINLAFPWRLSTFLVLAGIVLCAAALCVPDSYRPRRSLLISGAVILPALLFGAGRILPGRVVVAFVAALLVPASIAVAGRWQHSGKLRGSMARWIPFLVVSLGFVPTVVHGLEQSHIRFRPDDPARNHLYEWVRAFAPEGEVFAVPPSWKEFRLVAERPIVVDHKATPLNSRPDLVEWYDRLTDLTGVRPANNVEELDAAFFDIDCDRAGVLRSRYGLRFLVRDANREFACGTAVYSDDRYVIFDLGP